jgi:hypothetical protein
MLAKGFFFLQKIYLRMLSKVFVVYNNMMREKKKYYNNNASQGIRMRKEKINYDEMKNIIHYKRYNFTYRNFCMLAAIYKVA